MASRDDRGITIQYIEFCVEGEFYSLETSTLLILKYVNIQYDAIPQFSSSLLSFSACIYAHFFNLRILNCYIHGKLR